MKKPKRKSTLGHKIIVVGCPGSGKSFVSKAICKAAGYPIYHLDLLFWNENWVKTPKDIFEQKINEVLATQNYIIDGNYASTFEMRFSACDTVVFMDLPTRVCLRQEKARRNVKRSDFPEFLIETYDKEFINFIKKFRRDSRKVILEYIKKYNDISVIILKSKRQTDKFIEDLNLS